MFDKNSLNECNITYRCSTHGRWHEPKPSMQVFILRCLKWMSRPRSGSPLWASQNQSRFRLIRLDHCSKEEPLHMNRATPSHTYSETPPQVWGTAPLGVHHWELQVWYPFPMTSSRQACQPEWHTHAASGIVCSYKPTSGIIRPLCLFWAAPLTRDRK